MTERIDKSCGCAYIRPGTSRRYDDTSNWYQVIACPDHPMDMRPLSEVPAEETR